MGGRDNAPTKADCLFCTVVYATEPPNCKLTIKALEGPCPLGPKEIDGLLVPLRQSFFTTD